MAPWYFDWIAHSFSRDSFWQQWSIRDRYPSVRVPDRYVYDPTDPAPSVGGHSCFGARSGPQGSYDQTPVEQRSEVLV